MSAEKVLPILELLSLAGPTTGEWQGRLAEVYEQARPSLVLYVRQLVGPGDAEDLVQVAFLRLYQQLVRRQSVENVRGWLYRVVHNLAIDHLRIQNRREWLLDQNVRPAGPTAATAEEAIIRRQQIVQALSRLTDRERHCLLLRAEGLSYREIGQIVGTSAKAVGVYLARGLKKFEDRYE